MTTVHSFLLSRGLPEPAQATSSSSFLPVELKPGTLQSEKDPFFLTLRSTPSKASGSNSLEISWPEIPSAA